MRSVDATREFAQRLREANVSNVQAACAKSQRKREQHVAAQRARMQREERGVGDERRQRLDTNAASHAKIERALSPAKVHTMKVEDAARKRAVAERMKELSRASEAVALRRRKEDVLRGAQGLGT